MVLPDKITVGQHILKNSVHNLVRRCVEHGIWNALWSAAEHSRNIGKQNEEPILEMDKPSLMQGTAFLFGMLTAGWGSATIVFVVEIVLAKIYGY